MDTPFVTKFTKPYGGKLFPMNFGTVRLHNPDKYFIGALHTIVVDDEKIGEAKVIAVRPFFFKMLRDPLTWLDGNLDTKRYAEMLKRMNNGKVAGGVNEETEFDHVIFHWEKRIFPIHVKMINAYMQAILDEQRFYDFEAQ